MFRRLLAEAIAYPYWINISIAYIAKVGTAHVWCAEGRSV